jgi:hypothetical protein
MCILCGPPAADMPDRTARHERGSARPSPPSAALPSATDRRWSRCRSSRGRPSAGPCWPRPAPITHCYSHWPSTSSKAWETARLSPAWRSSRGSRPSAWPAAAAHGAPHTGRRMAPAGRRLLGDQRHAIQRSSCPGATDRAPLRRRTGSGNPVQRADQAPHHRRARGIRSRHQRCQHHRPEGWILPQERCSGPSSLHG